MEILFHYAVPAICWHVRDVLLSRPVKFATNCIVRHVLVDAMMRNASDAKMIFGKIKMAMKIITLKITKSTTLTAISHMASSEFCGFEAW